MARFAETIGRIYNPFPSVVPFVDLLSKSVSYAVAPDPSPGFGTLTASRRPSKPFIIGFIPPDNDVNFIPVERTFSAVRTISPNEQPAIGEVGVKAPKRNNGPPTEQPRQLRNFSAEELRSALFKAYKQVTGQTPTEATLGILYAQVQVENGRNPGAKNMSAPNYNLGASHVSYNSGQVPSRYTDDDPAKGLDPNSRMAGGKPFAKPKFGTYFYATDHDGPPGGKGSGFGRPFAVAFNSFNNLQDGAAFQISIVGGWSGALGAQTPEEYIDLVKPIKEDPTTVEKERRSGYFGADPEHYGKRLREFYDAYREQFPNPMGSPDKPNIQIPADLPQELTIMSPNSATDFVETDPIGDRVGRNIQVASAERQAVAKLQTDALREQIEIMRGTPPLVMLVNPNEIDKSYENSYDDSPKGRYTNIPHVWLERPMKLKANGVTAGQYAVDASGAGGLTNGNRIHSLSYANLMSLIMTYKNNGVINAGSESDPGIAIVACSVFIYYDEHIYLGSFDDLTVDDAGDKPHNLGYSFTFNSRYDLELDMTNTVVDSDVVGGLRF